MQIIFLYSHIIITTESHCLKLVNGEISVTADMKISNKTNKYLTILSKNNSDGNGCGGGIYTNNQFERIDSKIINNKPNNIIIF